MRIAQSRNGLVPGEITSWLGYLSLGMAFNLIGPSLPALRTYLGQGYGALGVLFAAAGAGLVISYMWSNRWVDRLGYRRAMIGALFAYSLCLMAAVATRSLFVWAAAVGVGAAVGGAVDVVGARLLGETAPRRRGQALNLLNVFYGVGAVITPLLVAIDLSTHRSVIWPFALTAAALFAVGLYATLSMRSVPPPVRETGSLMEGLAWAVGQVWLRPLAVLLVLYNGAEVAFGGWIASYGHVADHLPLATAAALPFVFWAAMVIGRGASAERARHWAEEVLLRTGALTGTAGMIVVLLWHQPIGLLVGVVVAGFGLSPIFPSAFSLAARRAPTRQSASFGVLYPSGAAGTLVMPWLAGILFAAVGPWAAIFVPVCAGIAMGAILFVWLRLVRLERRTETTYESGRGAR